VRIRCEHRTVCYEQGVQVFDRTTPFAPGVLLTVALGGSIGASGRWFVAWALDEMTRAHQPGTWPWSTLVVNVVGCALIGFAARGIQRDTKAWAFVVTGVLGGFTTFSALAVELNEMADADRMSLALAYAGVTLVAGIAATGIADLERGRR